MLAILAVMGGCGRPAATTSVALPRAEAWAAYHARSVTLRARDTALVYGELQRLGLARPITAPYLGPTFDEAVPVTPAFMRTDSARVIGENVLSFQTPSGGWSKRVDFRSGPRKPGQSFFSESDRWQYIATFDNGGTTSQWAYLVALEAAQPDPRWREGMRRAFRYVLDAQMPNGCWPQVFPLMGGYHDAATFNDDVIVRAAELLDDVATGRATAFTPADRDTATARLALAVDCMVRAQVVVNGVRTVWGQQHDPITLQPIAARSYEPASLSSKESAAIGRFLLTRPSPPPQVIAAVHAAADWFKSTRIDGYRYENYVFAPDSGAGPLWPRLSEIGTNRPIFSNRDGKVLYDWNALTDRRTGYGWFSDAPAPFLNRYERWARTHPRTP